MGPSWLDEIRRVEGSPGCVLRGVQFRLKTIRRCLIPITMDLTWTVMIADARRLGGRGIARLPVVSRPTCQGIPMTPSPYTKSRSSKPEPIVPTIVPRASNGSSDSIYVPDGFNVDPDNSETLSQDGTYRWEVGGLFTISRGRTSACPWSFVSASEKRRPTLMRLY